MPMASAEQVVLLDDSGVACGAMDKAAAHSSRTPLHLAFSCYLSDSAGRLLMTRRALGKKTFAGVWTNSCCGHPAPAEELADAVRRRVDQELGLAVTDLELVLPDYRYRAVDTNGMVENEICPVFVATAVGSPRPDPDEVMAWTWTPWPVATELARNAPWSISPWAAEQLTQLPRN